MNERLAPCTLAGVDLRVACALGCALLAGCGAPDRSASTHAGLTPAGGPASASILLQNHLPWPYKLEQAAVALDGELQYAKTGEIPSQTWVAVYDKLPTGEHTIQVRATALYGSGTIGDQCSILLRATHTFKLGAAPARVILDVHTDGITQDFVKRVRLDIRATGVEPLGDVASAGDSFQQRIRSKQQSEQANAVSACQGVQGVAAAICIARARVDMARRDKDVVKLTCYNDKLVQMNVLRDVVERRSADELGAQSSGDQAAAAHARAVREIAIQRIDQLLQELDACVCEYPAFLDRPIEQFSGRPACRGTDDVGPIESLSLFRAD